VIIHSADKEGAAARLRKAIDAEGYGVTAVEVEEPDKLADAIEGCAADAKILIWSRPLVFHSLHSGDLTRIRQLPALIEVSADGIKPPSRGDEARVVLISGWRGQPFHPGWQRLHQELKSLCGTRKSAAVPPGPPGLSPKTRPANAASALPGSGGGPVPAKLILGGAAGFLLIATAVGAANWIGGSSPDVQPPREYRQAPPPGPNGDGPVRGLGAVPAAGAAGAAAPEAAPAPQRSSLPPTQGVAPVKAQRERPQAARASRPAAPKSSGKSRQRLESQVEPRKKYSTKNSKVMRQFCERSGRSTPQCRTFLRSVRTP
jgi:hypothetical protein